MFKIKRKQESPPAWTQEAYRPPCSKYFLCCAILAEPPPPPAGGLTPPSWTWPPRLDLTPPPTGPDPPSRLDLTPPKLDLNHPPQLDLPPPPPLDLTAGLRTDPPPRLDWGLTPPPRGQTESWMDGQMRVKTLPSSILRMRAVKILHLLVNMGIIHKIRIWNVSFKQTVQKDG